MSCVWCHNPEGIKPELELVLKPSKCTFCKECIDACPNNAITPLTESIEIERDECDLCENCFEVCPSKALEVWGEEWEADKVLEVATRDIEFYEKSGGGVTFSGGEPLMQFEFLKELLEKSKGEGLHTCLDTSGYSSEEKLKELLKYTDIVLYDVKTLDQEKHKKFTGVSNSIILKNLELCLKSDAELVVRIPLILGYNFEDLENELAGHIVQLKNSGCDKFELIPYHSFGEQKYKMLGKKQDLEPESIKNHNLERLVDKLRKKHNVSIQVNTPILT